MTDTHQILKHLKKHRQIDHKTAERVIGTTSIRSRMPEVRRILEAEGKWTVENVGQTVKKRPDPDTGKKRTARVGLWKMVRI